MAKNIPVYLFTGFLEAGKTKMIEETLEDPEFNDGAKILLIVCEEGIEEYDPSRFAGQNVRMVTVEKESDLTLSYLTSLTKGILTDRVMIAIMENFQQEDGTVIVPEVLRPICGFDRIEPIRK